MKTPLSSTPSLGIALIALLFCTPSFGADYTWVTGNVWTTPTVWGNTDPGDYPSQVGDTATFSPPGPVWMNLDGLPHTLTQLNVGSSGGDIHFSNSTSGRLVFEAPGAGLAEINTTNMTASRAVNLPNLNLQSDTIVNAMHGRLNFNGRHTSWPALSGPSDVSFRGAGGISVIASFGINATNPYTGNITVEQSGTLYIEASVADHTGTSVTVANTGTLGGSSVLSRATTIQSGGILAPGAVGGSGVLEFGAGLTMESGARFGFTLSDNTTADRGVNFNGADVTAGLLDVSSGALFDIVLNGAGSAVDFSDPFWSTNQSWLVFGGFDTTTGGDIFTLGTVSQDSLGQEFSITGGEFSFNQSGDDIHLVYSIPEPASIALVAGLFLFAVAAWQRR